MEGQRQFKRNTAYKVWIQDVHKAAEKIDEENGLPYLDIKEKKVVRIHIFGSVIHNSISENFGNLILDDGSGNISLKVWGEDLYLLGDKQIGDLVFVIGRYAKFNNERYIRPEIVRLVNMDWALLRRTELTKEYGVPSKEEKVVVNVETTAPTEVEPSLAAREAILIEIEKQDEADEESLIAACNLPKEKIMTALQELLKEGEVFSPKMGYYRLV